MKGYRTTDKANNMRNKEVTSLLHGLTPNVIYASGPLQNSGRTLPRSAPFLPLPSSDKTESLVRPPFPSRRPSIKARPPKAPRVKRPPPPSSESEQPRTRRQGGDKGSLRRAEGNLQ